SLWYALLRSPVGSDGRCTAVLPLAGSGPKPPSPRGGGGGLDPRSSRSSASDLSLRATRSMASRSRARLPRGAWPAAGVPALARHDADAWDDAEGKGAHVGVRRALPPPLVRLEIRAGGSARRASGRRDQDGRAPRPRARGRRTASRLRWCAPDTERTLPGGGAASASGAEGSRTPDL